jgi:hypothetical protein
MLVKVSGTAEPESAAEPKNLNCEGMLTSKCENSISATAETYRKIPALTDSRLETTDAH